MRERNRVVIDCSGDETLTKQEFLEEADINIMVKRFRAGLPVPEPPARALYGDFSHAGDFQAAQQSLKKAEAEFAALPSDVRSRFQNDPQQLLEFCDDPANADEGVELGLFKAPAMPPAPELIQVEVVGGEAPEEDLE